MAISVTSYDSGMKAVGTTYQHQTGFTATPQMRILIGDPSEDDNNYYMRFNSAFQSNGDTNHIIYTMGYYAWDDSGNRTAVHTATGDYEYGDGSANSTHWNNEHIITIAKGSTKTRLTPWAQICGFYRYSTWSSPHWANGDFWIWGNQLGVLDMRSIDTSNCKLGEFTYGDIKVDAFWMIGSNAGTNTGEFLPASAPITIPAKGPKVWPVWVYNSSGVPKQAKNIYVYNSSGAPKEATSLTVYDSSGKPRTVTKKYTIS